MGFRWKAQGGRHLECRRQPNHSPAPPKQPSTRLEAGPARAACLRCPATRSRGRVRLPHPMCPEASPPAVADPAAHNQDEDHSVPKYPVVCPVGHIRGMAHQHRPKCPEAYQVQQGEVRSRGMARLPRPKSQVDWPRRSQLPDIRPEFSQQPCYTPLSAIGLKSRSPLLGGYSPRGTARIPPVVVEGSRPAYPTTGSLRRSHRGRRR